jgi:NAD(P)-dependent dehydrogenase (short-subunit alcohol dehydrogenase family)
LGRALARHYASKGATPGLIVRRADLLETLARDLAEAVIYPADVLDACAMQAVADHFMRRHDCPDIVIANAGVSRRRVTQFFEDSKVFEAILATNVLGIVNLFHPYLTAMRASGHGVLVGVASIGGYRGLPTGGGAYSASKAAAISYLESRRVKMHGSGVSVITVCLGFIITPMTAEKRYVEEKKLFSVIPWHRGSLQRY